MQELQEKTITYGEIEYDPSSKIIKLNQQIVNVGLVPTYLFETLLQNRGKLVHYKELLKCLEQPSQNALRVNLTKIKKELKIHITNIRAQGYILEEL